MSDICPLKMFNEVVGGKWKQSIICILEDEKSVRYNEIKRKIPEITNMMLSQSLKSLEEYGIISRKQYNEMPVRVEYSLTKEGKTLIPVLDSMNSWGREYIKRHNEYQTMCENCQLVGKGKH